MNKIAIPAILVATVMVAGMFAFMPVEQASTVHTSGDIVSDDVITTIDIDDGTDITNVGGVGATQTYTYSADEAVEIFGIIVIGDMSAFTDAGDLLEITDVTLDGVSIDVNDGVFPFTVSIGTDGGQTITDVFIELADGNNDIAYMQGLLLVPETALAIVLDVTDVGANDGALVVPIDVVITTSSRTDTAEGIDVT